MRRTWDVLVALTATYGAVVVPLDVVSARSIGLAPFWQEILLTLVFGTDLLVRWRGDRGTRSGRPVPTLRSGLLTNRPFMRTLDLLAALPVYVLVPIPTVRLIRLLKLARVARFLDRLRQSFMQYANGLRLTFFAYWISLFVHWLTLGWIWMTPGGSLSGGDQYARALYWCVTTLTTVGYGDVTPDTTGQTLYAVVVMIVGVGMYSYVIGNVANLIATSDPARANYLERRRWLTSFMQYRDFPLDLQRRIRNYYDYLWDRRLIYDESEILSELPEESGEEVALFLKRDLLEQVPLFEGAEEELLEEIAVRMEPVVVMPGDRIIEAGDEGREMYFIVDGTVEVLSEDETTTYTRLHAGDFFGEMALVMERERSATVRARTHCHLYRLSLEVFQDVVAEYPEIADEIEVRAQERREEL